MQGCLPWLFKGARPTLLDLSDYLTAVTGDMIGAGAGVAAVDGGVTGSDLASDSDQDGSKTIGGLRWAIIWTSACLARCTAK